MISLIAPGSFIDDRDLNRLAFSSFHLCGQKLIQAAIALRDFERLGAPEFHEERAYRDAAMQRASLASSSLENRNAQSPGECAAAATIAAAAPLMSQAPRPMAFVSVTSNS